MVPKISSNIYFIVYIYIDYVYIKWQEFSKWLPAASKITICCLVGSFFSLKASLFFG